jgi:hypothetical protein
VSARTRAHLSFPWCGKRAEPKAIETSFFAAQKNEEAAAPWSVDGGHLVDLTAVIG